jgi:hypothetical protein
MDSSGDVKPHCKGQYFDFWKVHWRPCPPSPPPLLTLRSAWTSAPLPNCSPPSSRAPRSTPQPSCIPIKTETAAVRRRGHLLGGHSTAAKHRGGGAAGRGRVEAAPLGEGGWRRRRWEREGGGGAAGRGRVEAARLQSCCPLILPCCSKHACALAFTWRQRCGHRRRLQRRACAPLPPPPPLAFSCGVQRAAQHVADREQLTLRGSLRGMRALEGRGGDGCNSTCCSSSCCTSPCAIQMCQHAAASAPSSRGSPPTPPTSLLTCSCCMSCSLFRCSAMAAPSAAYAAASEVVVVAAAAAAAAGGGHHALLELYQREVC